MAVRPPPADDGRVRTVFLGSGAFAVPAFRRLAANPLVRIVAVVSAPPRRAGRSQAWTTTPVAAAAAGLDLHPVLTPPRLRHPERAGDHVDLGSPLGVAPSGRSRFCRHDADELGVGMLGQAPEGRDPE